MGICEWVARDLKEGHGPKALPDPRGRRWSEVTGCCSEEGSTVAGGT